MKKTFDDIIVWKSSTPISQEKKQEWMRNPRIIAKCKQYGIEIPGEITGFAKGDPSEVAMLAELESLRAKNTELLEMLNTTGKLSRDESGKIKAILVQLAAQVQELQSRTAATPEAPRKESIAAGIVENSLRQKRIEVLKAQINGERPLRDVDLEARDEVLADEAHRLMHPATNLIEAVNRGENPPMGEYLAAARRVEKRRREDAAWRKTEVMR